MRRLSGTHRSVRHVLFRTWNSYEIAKFITYATVYARRAPGTAPIDPYRVDHIDPTEINRYAGADFDFLTDTGRVAGGDWDRTGTPVVEQSPYPSFQAHFHDGIPWEQTELFQNRASRIRQGNDRRYGTTEELKRAFERYDELYEQLASNGYQTQRELLDKSGGRGLGNGGRGWFGIGDWTAMRHEIAVSIGRSGDFCLNDGRHRLVLARLLGLESVPVRIVVRHEEWQDVRHAVATGERNPPSQTSEDESIHPDLQDLV